MPEVKNLPFEQIRQWMRRESAKGRSMAEITKQLATRSDVTFLSVTDTSQQRHEKIAKTVRQSWT